MEYFRFSLAEQFNPLELTRLSLSISLRFAKITKTLSELSSEYGVHTTQISEWKNQLLRDKARVFSTTTARQQRDQEPLQGELYEQIGRLKLELEWPKKKLPNGAQDKRVLIEPAHSQLSIRRQCELVDLNRSTYYYSPAGESDLNLRLMRLIDEQYTKTPFYGWPRMTAYLRRPPHKCVVNHKRVQRLMQKMGLQAIYSKPRTSKAAKGHKVYPYLLRNLAITRPNQVWSADITYIRFKRFVLPELFANSAFTHIFGRRKIFDKFPPNRFPAKLYSYGFQ